MLSFIRKRLPSKDRTDEHLQHVKDDEQAIRSRSVDDLRGKEKDKSKSKKKKRKETLKSSSTLDQLAHPSPTINQSYSQTDYFPMMPGALSQSIHDQKTSTHSDEDCYINRMEILPDINYVQAATATRSRVIQIPVIDCRTQATPDYKDIDHQRTHALREVTQQRTRKGSVH